jgi:hypothetical protein
MVRAPTPKNDLFSFPLLSTLEEQKLTFTTQTFTNNPMGSHINQLGACGRSGERYIRQWRCYGAVLALAG